MKTAFTFTTLLYILNASAQLTTNIDDFDVTVLNNPTESTSRISLSLFSENGQKVVYAANEQSPDNEGLFVVRSNGKGKAQLNNGSQPNTKIGFSQINKSGTRVIYWSDQDSDDVVELYSVAIDGSGPPVKLNSQLTAGGDIKSAMITPDDKHVIYRADQDIDEIFELYIVPIKGGKVTKLNKPLVQGRNTKRFGTNVGMDSKFITFIADQDQQGVFELFLSPLGADAGETIKLSQPLLAGQKINETNISISPNSRYVLYTVGPEDSRSGKTELFSASTDTTNPSIVNLSQALKTDFSVFFGTISSDSTRVIITPWDVNNGFQVVGLYSLPIQGGTPIRLDSDDKKITLRFDVTPDGASVIYSGDDAVYSTPLLGGKITLLDNMFENLSSSRLFLTDQRLIYTTSRSGLVGLEIRSTPPRQADSIILDEGNVLSFAITPDGKRIFYAKRGDDGGFFTSSTDKKDVLRLLTNSELGTISSGSVKVDPTGSFAMFSALAADGKARLYSVSIPNEDCDTFVIPTESGKATVICI